MIIRAENQEGPLARYLARRGYSAQRLAVESDVGVATVFRARRGCRLSYATAERISRATGGEVSVVALVHGAGDEAFGETVSGGGQ